MPNLPLSRLIASWILQAESRIPQRHHQPHRIRGDDELQRSPDDAPQRVTKGLEFLANYTWSKSLTNNLGYYGAGGGAAASQSAYWQNSYNGGADYGPAYFDATNIFSFSGYYDLPFGRGRQFGSDMNRFVDLAVGGWKVGAIASLHTGMPVTMFSNQNFTRSISVPTVPTTIANSSFATVL